MKQFLELVDDSGIAEREERIDALMAKVDLSGNSWSREEAAARYDRGRDTSASTWKDD